MLSFFRRTEPHASSRCWSAASLLERHPQLGRVVSECGPWQLREAVDRWHRKLYRLRADAIEIVTIAPSWMPLDERDPDDE
jgi:hypothetical protein